MYKRPMKLTPVENKKAEEMPQAIVKNLVS